MSWLRRNTGMALLSAVMVVLAVAVVQAVQSVPADTTAAVANTARDVAEPSLTLLVAFYLPRLLQLIKCSDSRWAFLMRDGHANYNRAVSFVLALAAAVGIHHAFGVDGDGWHLSIGGPQRSVTELALDVAKQFALNQFFYEHMPSSAQAKLDDLRRLLSQLGVNTNAPNKDTL